MNGADLRPAERQAGDLRHLRGYDPKKLPRFRWRRVALGDHPRATIQTALGNFDVELDAKSAPEAATLFLAIALDGGYRSGRFQRGVRDSEGSTNGFVGAEANTSWLERSSKHLKLGTVPATASKPADGTIALVRGGTPGAFLVFVGAPTRSAGDVVPFGRVVKGAEVVRKLLAAEENTKLSVAIRRVIRTQ